MFRVASAAILLSILVLGASPVAADMKIITVGQDVKPQKTFVKRHRPRHFRVVAIAVPRCHMVEHSGDHPDWRGLACPRIAWAGSAPRQPWSYEVFKRYAPWQQRAHLWQTHLRPSPTHPTIFWGY
jgi:hypothetical protein